MFAKYIFSFLLYLIISNNLAANQLINDSKAINELHEYYQSVYNLNKYPDEGIYVQFDYSGDLKNKLEELKSKYSKVSIYNKDTKYILRYIGKYEHHEINFNDRLNASLSLLKNIDNGKENKNRIASNIKEIIFTDDLNRSYCLLKSLNNRILWNNRLETENINTVVYDINETIMELAFNSYAGIYSEIDRQNLNLKYIEYMKELQYIYDKYGIKSKLLINLSVNDSILSPTNAYRVWWKIKYIDEYQRIDRVGLAKEIMDIEKDLCSDNYFNNINKYKEILFDEIHLTSKEINVVRRYDFTIESKLFYYFPVDKVNTIWNKYPEGTSPINMEITPGLIEDLYQNYLRFCTIYR